MLYRYPGFHGCLSHCDLEIIRSSSTTTLIICTERADNPGTSVTNLAAELATRVCEEDETIDPARLLWVEHYPPSPGIEGDCIPATWAWVIFTEREGTTFRRATWQPLNVSEMQDILMLLKGG